MYALVVKNNLDVQDHSWIYLANLVRQRKKELTIYTLAECAAEWILVSEKYNERTIEQNTGEPLIGRKTVPSIPSTIVNSSFSLCSFYCRVLSNISCGILIQLQSCHLTELRK